MQEWKQELCRERPEELQALGKDMYIQRRNIVPYEKKGADGETEEGYSCECRILSKSEYLAFKEQEERNAETDENTMISMAAQAEIYEKLLATEENQIIIMQAIAEVYETQTGGV